MSSMIDMTGYFIGLCFAVFALWWIVTAFSTKRTVRRAGWWRFFVLGTALLAFLIRRTYVGPIPWSASPLWRRSVGVGLLADVMALSGLVVMLWARTTLGRNWSSAVVLKEDHELITRGPYRYVRHPIYSGILLLLLAAAIWNGKPIAIAFWGLAVVMLWIKANAEERLLTQHFGDGYREYKSRVKALLPYVF